MRSTTSRTLMVLTSLLTLAACGDDPGTVTVDLALVAGDYSAAGALGAFTLTTTGSDGETVDWLDRGATFTLYLTEDGMTTGRISVPGGGENGVDFDADLAGSWSVSGDVVRFSHEADTFLRDMDFVYEEGRLIGQETFDGTKVRLVLIRL